MKNPAKLRVCASCEWIFNIGVECPKCHFGSYGAHYVYGNKAYKYKLTQEPWLNGKLDNYRYMLLAEIRADSEKCKKRIQLFEATNE